MKPATRALVLSAALACLTPFDAAAQDLTCDPAALDAESYRLTVEETARNVTAPRSSRWAPVGDHLADLDDLNASSIGLAERARRLDDRNLLAHAQLARQYVIDGIDARLADAEWRRVLASGGAIAWTATLYDVDARSYVVVAFDRAAMRIYRMGQLATPLRSRFGGVFDLPGPEHETFWRAVGGCLPPGVVPEATIPWAHVERLEAKNWVLEFHLADRVSIGSDRGSRKTVDRIKVNLHGASGDLEVRYKWDPYRGATNVRGVATGPASYQERVRRTLVKFVDAGGRIALPPQKRGAGW
jgi:hypothetical protein